MTPEQADTKAREIVTNRIGSYGAYPAHKAYEWREWVEDITDALLQVIQETREADYQLVRGFSWVLPVYGNEHDDELSDDVACAVLEQAAEAIRHNKGEQE